MVAKINRGASLYGAIIYNLQKVNDNTARIIYGNRMIANVSGNTERVMQQTLWAFDNYRTGFSVFSPAYIVEPFFGRPAHGFAIHGTGQGVYAANGLWQPALHCIYARGHRPEAYPYRFHLRERKR